MKLNERSLVQFAISAPSDKEGYLNKKGELNRGYQRRWFVLKGNLFYYFEREGDKEAIGVIILENSHVELAESEDQPYAFQISYGGAGVRTYLLGANSSKEMESWMKALTNANYACLKMMVEDLQRRLSELTTTQNEIQLSVCSPSPDIRGNSTTELSNILPGGQLILTNDTEIIQSRSLLSLGGFQPSTSVSTLIELDSSCDENDPFSVHKCSDDLLPLNFNEFQHLQALHANDFDSYPGRNKSIVNQDDSSMLTQKVSSGHGKSSRTKSERRRNGVGSNTPIHTSHRQTHYMQLLVDERYGVSDHQVSTFVYLHDMYGASIWVKAKECGKNDLL